MDEVEATEVKITNWLHPYYDQWLEIVGAGLAGEGMALIVRIPGGKVDVISPDGLRVYR